MDTSLNAQTTLDVTADIFRIDVRGSLSQDSRPDLMRLIQRVRRMGITSHIRVYLGRAEFVESAALAGLRRVLNVIDGAAALVDSAGALPGSAGVSVDLNPHPDSAAAALPSIDLSADLVAPVHASDPRPLNVYSDDELFAASDSLFGLLDNPATMARSQLLASYDEIGLEISRREIGLEPARPVAAREPEPASAGLRSDCG